MELTKWESRRMFCASMDYKKILDEVNTALGHFEHLVAEYTFALDRDKGLSDEALEVLFSNSSAGIAYSSLSCAAHNIGILAERCQMAYESADIITDRGDE